jgi:hypothetical protein
MGIRERVEAYKKERAKLKAIEKAAYTGAMKKEKQLKELEKQRKAVQRAEKAAEKGIAKAKAGGTWGIVATAVKKEAAHWDLGDGKVTSAKKKRKPTARKCKTTTTKKKPTAAKKKTTKRVVHEVGKSRTFNGKRYKCVDVVGAAMSSTVKKKLKAQGKLVRVVSTREGDWIYTRNK